MVNPNSEEIVIYRQLIRIIIINSKLIKINKSHLLIMD